MKAVATLVYVKEANKTTFSLGGRGVQPCAGARGAVSGETPESLVGGVSVAASTAASAQPCFSVDRRGALLCPAPLTVSPRGYSTATGSTKPSHLLSRAWWKLDNEAPIL